MTSASQQHEDENYEKPSRHKLWHERSGKPIATRPMMKSEIEDYRKVLVNSYGCDNTDITFDFQKITDEDDDDRDDCIWLKYKMRCISDDGKTTTTREIFNIKLPIPDEIRKMAETLRRQQTDHANGHVRRNRAAIGYVNKVTGIDNNASTVDGGGSTTSATSNAEPRQITGGNPVIQQQTIPSAQPTPRTRACRPPTRPRPKV